MRFQILATLRRRVYVSITTLRIMARPANLNNSKQFKKKKKKCLQGNFPKKYTRSDMRNGPKRLTITL